MTQSWVVMPGRPKSDSKLALQNLWISWLSVAVMVIELWKISILDYIMETCMHRTYFVYLGSWMWKYKAERATVPDSLKSFGCSLSYPHYSIAASHVAHLEIWVSMVVCVFYGHLPGRHLQDDYQPKYSWRPFCSFIFLWCEGESGMAPAFSEYD